MLGNYSQTKTLEKYRYLGVGSCKAWQPNAWNRYFLSPPSLGRLGVALTGLADFVSKRAPNFHTPRESASAFGKRSLQA